MKTFSVKYRQNRNLVFDIYESNYAIPGIPSVVIYADNHWHTKFPYLLREVTYIKEPEELKLETELIFVLRHSLHNKPEMDRTLASISNDLNNFRYFELSPKEFSNHR